MNNNLFDILIHSTPILNNRDTYNRITDLTISKAEENIYTLHNESGISFELTDIDYQARQKSRSIFRKDIDSNIIHDNSYTSGFILSQGENNKFATITFDKIFKKLHKSVSIQRKGLKNTLGFNYINGKGSKPIRLVTKKKKQEATCQIKSSFKKYITEFKKLNNDLKPIQLQLFTRQRRNLKKVEIKKLYKSYNKLNIRVKRVINIMKPNLLFKYWKITPNIKEIENLKIRNSFEGENTTPISLDLFVPNIQDQIRTKRDLLLKSIRLSIRLISESEKLSDSLAEDKIKRNKSIIEFHKDKLKKQYPLLVKHAYRLSVDKTQGNIKAMSIKDLLKLVTKFHFKELNLVKQEKYKQEQLNSTKVKEKIDKQNTQYKGYKKKL